MGCDATYLSVIVALPHQPLIAITDGQARLCGTEHPAKQPLQPSALCGRRNNREHHVAEIGEFVRIVFMT